MTTYEQAVSELCSKVTLGPSAHKIRHQIIIDLCEIIQDDLLDRVDGTLPGRDEVGAQAYACGLLLDIYNPIFTDDIEFLHQLRHALTEWSDDIERTNMALGLPKES